MGGNSNNLAEPDPQKEKLIWSMDQEDIEDIIEKTVAAVFDRERLYRDYDKLTAEWDRRNGR